MTHSIRIIETKGSKREVRKLGVSSQRLTLGRGTDQNIQIPDRRVPLEHSVLTLKENHVEIKANDRITFTVKDNIFRRAELYPGDVADIAGHKVRVILEDNTLIIEIELGDAQAEALRERFTTRLQQLNVRTRSLSWALFLLVLAAGMIIPTAGFFLGMDNLRQAPLPDDSIWLSGQLHHTHAFLGDSCEACHTTPFIPAKQEDCLACHASVNHHFAGDLFGHDYFVGDTCQDCHREHNGPAAITRTDQATCTGCHNDLEASGYPSLLLSTTDFHDDHPPFMISTLQMQEDQSWQIRRFNLWDNNLIERSNLKFPHDLHMDPEGIIGPDGNINMGCGDCHTVEKGGMGMKAIEMEQHCSSCHELTFDPAAPDRVVPHGEPEDLINLLRGYYAYQYFQRNTEPGTSPTLKSAPEPTRKARRPGVRRQTIAGYQESMPSQSGTKEAREYVDKRVNDAASTLFEKRTCVICHELDGTNGDGVWQVVPVKITSDWMPLAEFSHDSHQNMTCDGCHDAASSDKAGDVSMPDVESCRTCHGGEHSHDKLKSTCIACHNFHLDHQAPMSVVLSIDDSGNLIDQSGNFVDRQGNIRRAAEVNPESREQQTENQLIDQPTEER